MTPPDLSTPDLRHAEVTTTIGRLDVVVDTTATGDAVVGIYFPGHWTRPDRGAWGRTVEVESVPLVGEVVGQLESYFAGRRTSFDLPLDLRGPEFQQRVWAVLQEIPYGATMTYGAIAARLGSRNAQLVGQAVGHNPVSVVVPCHRVIGADGTLTGYAGGVDRKSWLLELEGAAPPSLFDEVPTFGQS
ncbi:methylated-DNA--[protein]-cysteine S-methyltransferase [Mariniluteicoccus endophyticus]